MSTLSQKSFSGGEIAPSMYARTDTAKYSNGLRTLRNMLVMRHGGATNRAGTRFVGELKDSSRRARMIPFVFNSDQTYQIELGHEYIRFVRNGGHIVEDALTITDLSQAAEAVVTSAAHGLSDGDWVYLAELVGPTELNGRTVIVSDATTNTFKIKYVTTGAYVDSSAMDAYVSGGTAERIYTLASTYQESDLMDIQFVQSADVITLVHKSYAPAELARLDHDSWTLTDIAFEPKLLGPNIQGIGSGPAGSTMHAYVITSIAENYEESFGGRGAVLGINGALPNNPVRIQFPTQSTLPLEGGEVYIEGMEGGYSVLNGKYFTAISCTSTSVDLLGVDGTSFGTYVAPAGGGFGDLLKYRYTNATYGTPSSSNPLVITWERVDEALEYNIYKLVNGLFGYVGTARGLTFRDPGIDPDVTKTPPNRASIFNEAGKYPGVVSLFQQRRAMANTDEDTEEIHMSKTGHFKNFTNANPVRDDDAISFTLAGREVNSIKHLIDIGEFVALTAKGEWSIPGDNSGILTPTSINPKQHTYNGSSNLAPIVLSGNALYVQARGSIVRDLGFDYQIDGYRGNDLTVFSAHLFDGHTIVDWAYQQTPHSIVWAVRDDGVLLGLTYIREHEMLAWHRHDTDGFVENVSVTPEGSEDAVYLIVRRTINGQTKRYIERMTKRQEELVEDLVFMDAALTYDGRNTDAAHTMTLSGGTTWAAEEELTITSSAAYFSASEVGNAIHLTDSNGDVIRFQLTGFTSDTVMTGNAHMTVPAALRGTATAIWARAVDQISGLDHLEGKDVSVFGDAYVLSSPNNANQESLTVTNGSITLERPYAVIHVGLPFVSDIETLDIDTVEGETISTKKKLVSNVGMFVEETRGVFVGGEAPDDTVSYTHGLKEVATIDEDASADSPPAAVTEVVDVNIESNWNSNGRIFARQVDPIPMTVLSICPSGYFPFPRKER